MTIDFQIQAIRFILKGKLGEVLEDLPKTLFTDWKCDLTYQVVRNFYAKYKVLVAGKAEILEFIDNSNAKQQLQGTLYTDYSYFLDSVTNFNVPDNDEFTADFLINNIKAMLITELNIEYADQSKLIVSSLQYFDRLEEIKNLRVRGNKSMYRGIDVYGGDYKIDANTSKVYPFPFPTLNSWRTTGGVRAPELHVFVSTMKAFKTTFCVTMADFWVSLGLDGLYCDNENGETSLQERFYMRRFGVEYKDLKILEPSRLRELYMAGGGKGSMYVSSYRPKRSTMDDVRRTIDRRISKTGRVPNFAIFDDPDKFAPISSRKSGSEQQDISSSYLDIMDLLSEYSMFGICVSQVTREAQTEKELKTNNVARDINKIASTHGSFAINAGDLEKSMNFNRISILAQRMGLKPDPERFFMTVTKPEIQSVEEIDMDSYLLGLQKRKDFLQTNPEYFIDEYNRIFYRGQPVYAYDQSIGRNESGW
jgi:hypothetical protein